MAPFKLKFRMGSSRSTSQETNDTTTDNPTSNSLIQQGNGTGSTATLLNNMSSTITLNSNDDNNYIIIDSDNNTDNNSYNDSFNNDQLALLHDDDNINTTITTNKTSNCGQIGYINPTLQLNLLETNNPTQEQQLGNIITTTTTTTGTIPLSPPPSYETVLEETRLAAALDKDNNPTIINTFILQQSVLNENTNANFITIQSQNNINNKIIKNREESLDSTLYSCSTMTSPSQENFLLCTGTSCDPLCNVQNQNQQQQHENTGSYHNSTLENDDEEHIIDGDHDNHCKYDENCTYDNNYDMNNDNNENDDDNLSKNNYITICDNINQCNLNDNRRCSQSGSIINNDNDDNISLCNMHGNNNNNNNNHNNNNNLTMDNDDSSDIEWNSHENQLAHRLHDMQANDQVINNKSSKELYKAVAKQWGITCKMSDQCRCMDCQSHYFDCEYEENEHQKTDGGLGAGTPMFISEVMRGTACNIL